MRKLPAPWRLILVFAALPLSSIINGEKSRETPPLAELDWPPVEAQPWRFQENPDSR